MDEEISAADPEREIGSAWDDESSARQDGPSLSPSGDGSEDQDLTPPLDAGEWTVESPETIAADGIEQTPEALSTAVGQHTDSETVNRQTSALRQLAAVGLGAVGFMAAVLTIYDVGRWPLLLLLPVAVGCVIGLVHLHEKRSSLKVKVLRGCLLGGLLITVLLASVSLDGPMPQENEAPNTVSEAPRPSPMRAVTPTATSTPTDTVEVPIFYDADFGPVKKIHHVTSPTLFHGKTFLAENEELWALLKPPTDPSANTSADRFGLFKVTDEGPIDPDLKGNWSTTVDIGRGECDEGKTYRILIIRAKLTEELGYRSLIDRRREFRRYPEFRKIPNDSQRIGEAKVELVRYGGGHHDCPGDPQGP